MNENFIQAVIFAAIFIMSYAGVVTFRRWSRRRGLLDVPNERSSHVAPTPRGGGVVIVFVCLGAYVIYAAAAQASWSWGYVAGAALIGLISWLDDLYTISFVWRFLIHAAAAALLIVSDGFFRASEIPTIGVLPFGATFGAALTFLWIVWLTNAYNFMDGIDGIAGLQAVAAGLGWLVAGHWLGLPSNGFYGGVIACASVGFLIENWQPARIFMGDVGSAFLGYTFAAMPLLARSESFENIEIQTFLPTLAVAFNWLFVFDTIFTVSGRALKKEKIWEAHRRHIYQRMVLAGYSHQTVSLLYGALSSLIILLAIFWLTGRDSLGYVLLLTTVAISTGLLLLVRRLGNSGREI